MGKFSDYVEDIKNQTDDLRQAVTNALGEDSFGLSIKDCADVVATRMGDTADLSSSTATEADVLAGKTFYSKTNEIKTGTLDFSIIQKYENIIANLISSEVETDIYIPETITRIRKYAYYTNPKSNPLNPLAYNANNLTIPNNIKTIEDYAFAYSNLTGTLTIPETCESILQYAFRNTNISEVIIAGGLIDSSSSHCFRECLSLTKAVITQEITKLPEYVFSSNSKLEEVYFPSTLTSIPTYSFEYCYNIKFLKFTSITPPTLTTNSLSWFRTALLLVPYDRYYYYFNATNYQKYSQPIVGYAEFGANEILPSSDVYFNYTWYATLDDVRNSTNPVTMASEDGTYYAVGTEIV